MGNAKRRLRRHAQREKKKAQEQKKPVEKRGSRHNDTQLVNNPERS